MNLCQASRNILASPYAKSQVQINLTNPVLWDHVTLQVSESLYCYHTVVHHILSLDLLFGGLSFPQNTPIRHEGRKQTNTTTTTNFKVLTAKAHLRALDKAAS